MSQETGRVFIDYSVRKLAQLTGRISDCLNRLDDAGVWTRGHDVENAAGNLVLHLTGNVRQWIVSGIGGLPDTRVRDGEFGARGEYPKTVLLAGLHQTVDQAMAILHALPPEKLTDPIAPQGYRVTVLEAIYHVVEHFAQHTGQIIYVTKKLTGEDLGYYKHLASPDGHSGMTP